MCIRNLALFGSYIVSVVWSTNNAFFGVSVILQICQLPVASTSKEPCGRTSLSRALPSSVETRSKSALHVLVPRIGVTGFQRHLKGPHVMITSLRNPLEVFVSAKQFIHPDKMKSLDEVRDECRWRAHLRRCVQYTLQEIICLSAPGAGRVWCRAALPCCRNHHVVLACSGWASMSRPVAQTCCLCFLLSRLVGILSSA